MTLFEIATWFRRGILIALSLVIVDGINLFFGLKSAGCKRFSRLNLLRFNNSKVPGFISTLLNE